MHSSVRKTILKAGPKTTPKTTPKTINRRALLDLMAQAGLGLSLASCSALSPSSQNSEDDVLELPLQLTTLAHHIGISVRDVLKSAEFYSRIFGGSNVFGEKEPALRYFIAFQPTDESVDAGDVAIGLLGTAGSVGQTEPLIDHTAVGAVPHSGAEWRAALAEININTLEAASILFDIDNIPIQVSGAVDGSMAAGEITAMPPLYSGEPLVESTGFDHVMLRVNDIELSANFYKLIFGLEPDSREGSHTIWYKDNDGVRLGMRNLVEGEVPGVDTYAVKVKPFNSSRVRQGLQDIGATIERPRAGESNQIIRFADIDGIKAVLTAV